MGSFKALLPRRLKGQGKLKETSRGQDLFGGQGAESQLTSVDSLDYASHSTTD